MNCSSRYMAYDPGRSDSFLINSYSANHNYIWVPNTSLSIKCPICWCIEWQSIIHGMRIISIPNSIFFRRMANFHISVWALPNLSCGYGGDMPDNGIFWMCSNISVIVFRYRPTQLLVRIAGWVLVWAVKDCTPLRGPIPDNSIGAIK